MKARTVVYRCTDCGHQEPKWLGRCPECGMWNTLKESSASPKAAARDELYSLPISRIDPSTGIRVLSGSRELDRVLGGGFMRGSAVLLGGEPGIGKSTLLLQVCAKLESKGRILYVSGEESPGQIRLRADRLGALKDNLEVLCCTDLERILAVMDAVKPVFVVIDSIQTIFSADAGAIPGTANQVKYCAMELTEWAKTHDAIIVFTAHVTKEGLIAGPKAAEHLVDAVLGFEQAEGDLRALRSTKNRFGSTDELGLYRMDEKGLVELADPTGVLLVRRKGELPPGIAVCIVHEGSRVLCVEIQALAVPAKAGITRVYSDRIDPSRVARVAAVIEKQTGIRLSDQDIYVNVAGGVRLAEPGIDLALAAAIYSARTGTPLPKGAALAGELSLAGEIRPVRQMARRARAARVLGFGTILGPGETKYGGAAGTGAENAGAEVCGARHEAGRADGITADISPKTAHGWTRVDSLKSSILSLWSAR